MEWGDMPHIISELLESDSIQFCSTNCRTFVFLTFDDLRAVFFHHHRAHVTVYSKCDFNLLQTENMRKQNHVRTSVFLHETPSPFARLCGMKTKLQKNDENMNNYD